MLRIKNYVRASSLQEAYDLCQKRSNVVLGGMLWLKMQDRSVQTAIDLCDLGLDQIIEEQDCYRIGAMVSLRQLETHPGLNALTQGAFADALKSIVGVQFRNLATVGGSLYGRFGFSDVLTMFLALDAKIRLYHCGELTAEEFAACPGAPGGILTEVIVYKRDIRAAYLSQRNSATDFPVVACAVCRIDGIYRCAVGARPGKAALLLDETGLLCPEADFDRAKQFGEWVSQKLEFGSKICVQGQIIAGRYVRSWCAGASWRWRRNKHGNQTDAQWKRDHRSGAGRSSAHRFSARNGGVYR